MDTRRKELEKAIVEITANLNELLKVYNDVKSGKYDHMAPEVKPDGDLLQKGIEGQKIRISGLRKILQGLSITEEEYQKLIMIPILASHPLVKQAKDSIQQSATQDTNLSEDEQSKTKEYWRDEFEQEVVSEKHAQDWQEKKSEDETPHTVLKSKSTQPKQQFWEDEFPDQNKYVSRRGKKTGESQEWQKGDAVKFDVTKPKK